MRRLARRFGRASTAAVRTYASAACSQRAAAISYHVLFSLVPFLAVLVSALELALPETAQERIVSWLLETVPLPEKLAVDVEDAVEQAGPPASVAGAVALAGLVWAASGMMSSIRSAFRAVWSVDADRPYLRGKALDVLLVLAAGLLVVSAFLASVVVQVVTDTGAELAERLGREESTAALNPLAQLAASTTLSALAFVALYRFVPPLEVRLRDVAPAAILAAVAAQLASAGFSVYLTRFADFDDVYGPLGAVLAFLLLVYVIAVVLLLGACLAAAWPQAAALPTGVPVPLRTRLVRLVRGLVVRDRSSTRGG